MIRRLALLALAVLLAAGTAPARADDDITAVRAKIAAAMTAAKSFVVTTSAATGMTGTMTFVAPNLYHSAVVFNRVRRDVVLVGAVAYMSEDDGHTYRKVAAPPELISAQAEMRAPPVDKLLPDKVVNAKTWGQFATSSGGPEKDQPLTCTYDKTTYRVGICSNAGLLLAFSRYDDPTNVVIVPELVTGSGK